MQDFYAEYRKKIYFISILLDSAKWLCSRVYTHILHPKAIAVIEIKSLTLNFDFDKWKGYLTF